MWMIRVPDWVAQAIVLVPVGVAVFILVGSAVIDYLSEKKESDDR